MRRVAAGLVVGTMLLLGVPAGAGHGVEVRRLAGGDRIGTAVAVSRDAFASSEVALLARADDFADALVGAPLAAAVDAPILLTDSSDLAEATAAELERLGADEVLLLGGEAALGRAVEEALREDGLDVRRIAGTDRFATAATIAREVGRTARVFVATGEDFPDALAAAPLGIPILLATRDVLPAATDAALAELEPDEIVVLGGPAAIGPGVEAALSDDRAAVRRVAGGDRYATAAAIFDAFATDQPAEPPPGPTAGPGPTESSTAGSPPPQSPTRRMAPATSPSPESSTAEPPPTGSPFPRDRVWLATGTAFPDALVAGPAIAATGGALLLVDGADVEATTPAVDRIHAAHPSEVLLLGGPAAIAAGAEDDVAAVVEGELLPGGGRVLFPTYRMVAFYGHATIPELGVLGEQPPDAAVERLAAQAEGYRAGDRPLLLTFELIITVATRAPGAEGLYRSPGSPEEVQTYLDAARRDGLYLLLDIQPGRSDFLTEVRRYERFLREPDVGVALDPEWRMGPNEVPGEIIGSVDAAEVNAVLDYLAGLVEEEQLPEKLVVVHQFTQQMVRNRDAVRAPDGLAVTFHVDGFGGRAAKLSKYDLLHGEPPFHNGFKLFYDEDTNLFAPADVLGFDPVPDLVTYQ